MIVLYTWFICLNQLISAFMFTLAFRTLGIPVYLTQLVHDQKVIHVIIYQWLSLLCYFTAQPLVSTVSCIVDMPTKALWLLQGFIQAKTTNSIFFTAHCSYVALSASEQNPQFCVICCVLFVCVAEPGSWKAKTCPGMQHKLHTLSLAITNSRTDFCTPGFFFCGGSGGYI